jgi:hypothetical protein
MEPCPIRTEHWLFSSQADSYAIAAAVNILSNEYNFHFWVLHPVEYITKAF